MNVPGITDDLSVRVDGASLVVAVVERAEFAGPIGACPNNSLHAARAARIADDLSARVDAERFAAIVAGKRREALNSALPRPAKRLDRRAAVRRADDFAQVVDAVRRAVVGAGHPFDPLETQAAQGERAVLRVRCSHPADDLTAIVERSDQLRGALWQDAQVLHGVPRSGIRSRADAQLRREYREHTADPI